MVATGQQPLHMMLGVLPTHVVELDDWKGVTTPAERRRIQNRVNQRAARKRKRLDAKHNEIDSPQRGPKPSSNQLPSSIPIGSKAEVPALLKNKDPGLWQMFHYAMKSVPVDRSKIIDFAQNNTLHPSDMQKALESFENWMYLLIGSPNRDCLFTLIQFNVFRSMVRNERDLGLPEAFALDDDSISPLSDAEYVIREMPPSLYPTQLQRKITHHPWIDLLPWPKVRDNLLRAQDTYDETELCTAIVGCAPNSDGRTGVIVWGEAWDPAGWEITEELIRHWGWILYGCEESLISTNYWRQRRGKKAVTYEI